MNKVGMFQVNGGTNAKSCRDLQRKDNKFFFNLIRDSEKKCKHILTVFHFSYASEFQI